MKKGILALLVILLALGLAVNAYSEDPPLPTNSVEIVSPTGTVFVDSFPATIPVTLKVSIYNDKNECRTNSINEMTISSGLVYEEEPVTFVDFKALPLEEADGHLCPEVYSFNWEVEESGEYVLTATVKWQGKDLPDFNFENIEIATDVVSVEYPAPPAVANAYLNSFPELKKQLNGKVRGCIISNIAHDHTLQLFGPKGGPYEGVEAAVREYNNWCGGPEIRE